MRKIKVQMLTREGFAPYGKVLDLDDIEPAGGNPETHMWYPQVSIVEKATSLNWMEVFPREFTAQKFEAHDYTNENLIPMTGGIIVTCMPKGELDVEKLAAFHGTEGACLDINKNATEHYEEVFRLGRAMFTCAQLKASTSGWQWESRA